MDRRIRRIAQRLLDELEANMLEVVLIPDQQSASYGNDFRMLRAAQSRNADWYRKLCKQHSSNRRFVDRWREDKTKIKRRRTIEALNEILNYRYDTPYAQMLISFINAEYPKREYKRHAVKHKKRVRSRR
jgi:hypothetical protein